MSISHAGPVLVLGGARSGKSSFSERLVEASGLGMHYVATGRAWDDEMRERIDHHRQGAAKAGRRMKSRSTSFRC